VALLCTGMVGLHPVTLSAALAPGIQGFTVTGTVKEFPCAVGPCDGSLGGLGTASISGETVAGAPFTAVWPDPGQPLPAANLTGGLSDIFDMCPVSGPAPSLVGSGNGSFSLIGGLLSIAGQQTGGATLSGAFSWLRSETAVVITVSSATVTNGSGLVVAQQATLVDGTGGGTFAV